MHQCLIDICMEFEKVENFFQDQSSDKEKIIHKLFLQFMECFKNLKEEKLNYPIEFQNDVKLYHEKYPPLLRKFEDIQIRYLLLSDFYDFVRLTKKYKK